MYQHNDTRNRSNARAVPPHPFCSRQTLLTDHPRVLSTGIFHLPAGAGPACIIYTTTGGLCASGLNPAVTFHPTRTYSGARTYTATSSTPFSSLSYSAVASFAAHVWGPQQGGSLRGLLYRVYTETNTRENAPCDKCDECATDGR